MITALVAGGAAAIAAVEGAAILLMLAADTRDSSADAEIQLWSEWIAPARDEDTAALAWPLRQTPTDLEAAYTGEPLPARPIGASWNVNTAAWHQMITEYRFLAVGGVEATDWRCDSCTTGRDGERLHNSCRGCGCPCTNAAGIGMLTIGARELVTR